MTVLEADQRGRSKREIAALLWGEERVGEDWWAGGWMHARAMLKAYRDLVAGRR